MKRLRKFVKNDRTEEIVIKNTAKTFRFHTKLDRSKGFIKVQRNMANHRLAADTVIITTPYSPYAFYQEMFDSPAKRRNDPFAQIERRITLTVMCTKDLICEVDFHSTNNSSFIVNSRNNPYSEKNRTQQTTYRFLLKENRIKIT